MTRFRFRTAARRIAGVALCMLFESPLPAAEPANAGLPAASAPGFPITIRSCNRDLVIDGPPHRAISYGSNLTEMMLALGLEERMIGYASVRPAARQVLGALYPGFSRLRAVSDGLQPIETMLDTGTDFLFAGWHYGLRPGSEHTPANLARLGIPTYELTESCANIGKAEPPTLNYLFRDLKNLGSIFGVSERAEALIASYRRRLALVAERVSGRAEPTVFVDSSGTRTVMTAGGLSMPQALIAAAGGRNIAADIPGSWLHVGWETFIDRNPQVIILIGSPGMSTDQRLAFLTSRPGLAHVDAVRQKRFVVLQYDELVPGPRNIEAVEKLARALHPAAFSATSP